MSHILFPHMQTTLWTDSSFTLLIDPLELAEKYPQQMVTFRHPHRSRIQDEIKVIIQHQKARPESVIAQLSAYQAEGFDTESNPQTCISAGGFILRRHTEEVKRFNEFWHHEVQTRTLRDQMSIDFSAWKTGVDIHHFAGNYLDNAYAVLTRMQRPVTDY